MACPWFYPHERTAAAHAILPLGDAWAGECRAPGAAPVAPDRDTVLDCCNLGYAGSRCVRFPGGGPDAVRFSIARRLEDVVTLCCVLEKDYLPFGRGALVYSIAGGRFTAAHPDPIVNRQAQAYIESYLRRTHLS